MDFTSNVVYQAPKYRDMSLEQKRIRLDGIRDARILVALDHRSIVVVKLNKDGDKKTVQFHKLNERVETKLEKVMEMITQLEKDLSKLSELHHEISLIEEGIEK